MSARPVVQAIESQQRCKLCRHGRRQAIDELLLRRSLGEADEAGRRFNLDYVLELLASEFNVGNPTKENVTTHWKKHSRVIDPGTDEEFVDSGALDLVNRYLPDPLERPPTDDEMMEFHSAARAFDVRRIAQGLKPLFGVTVDHHLKQVDAKTKRHKDEAQAELTQLTTLALGQAIAARDIPAPAGKKALPETVEGEGEYVDA